MMIQPIQVLLLAATVTLLALTTISVAAQNQALPDWLNGTWEGRGYQSDPLTEWDIQLYKAADDGTAVIKYPDLNCSGRWQMIWKIAERIVLREAITQNTGNCIGSMWVYLTRLDSDEVLAEYAFDWAPDAIVARGLLQRVR